MPQINSITVTDGATSPATHVFAIQERDGGKTVYRDSAGQTIAGCNVFAHTALLAKTAAAANRNIVTLMSPTEGATATGGVQVENVSNFKSEINFAPGLTVEQRKTKLVMYFNLMLKEDVLANLIAVSPSG